LIELYLGRAFLVSLRVGALMSFAPFFSNASLPATVKAGFTLVLTALLLPVYVLNAPIPAAGGAGTWAAMVLSEVALGLMAGFTTQFVFDGMLLAGQVIGFQFGFSLVNIIDPNSQVEITVLSTLHELAALLIFIQLGVHRWLLRAVAMSFQMVPLGSLGGTQVPAVEVLRMAGAMWVIGAEIAFPVIMATMLVDLTIGFLSKASPQFPALFFGISTKVMVGLGVLYGAVAFWPSILERYFFHALTGLEQLLSISH
jgi:flagellar biosynthesis protein FliR